MRRVLVVDHEKENVELLSKYLVEDGHSVQNSVDSETALHRLKAWKPHLIIFNTNIPNFDANSLIPKIRLLAWDEYIAIAFISASMTLEEVKKSFEAGLDDYLNQPFQPQDFMARVRSLLKLKEVQDALRQLEKLAAAADESRWITGKCIPSC